MGAKAQPRPDRPASAPWAVLAVAAAALLAAASRVPAVGAVLRPDESGYTLVARSWSPRPDSSYGPYWVDRPPVLIGTFRLTDALLGPQGIRWLAVLAAALVVLTSSGAAREVVLALRSGATRRQSSTVVVATALAGAALVANPSIDVLLAKGEILAVPLLLGAMQLSMRAVRTGSVPSCLLAGLLAGGAPGLKQNLVGGLVFGVVLLALARGRGHLDTRLVLRLGGGFVLGASVPGVATVAWAVLAGVDLPELWAAVYGVRADALGVIAGGPLGGVLGRAATMALVVVTSGLALLLGGLLVDVLARRRNASPVAWAALVTAAVDGLGVALGGFFRLPYLFALVPSAVLAVAILLTVAVVDGTRARRRTALLLVAATVGSSVVSAGLWLRDLDGFRRPTTSALLGRAIGAASGPGDSLTMVAGAADTQFQSGLPSPYPYLWSLPARVRDPQLVELAALLEGPAAPTWVVTVYDVGAVFGESAEGAVTTVLEERYEDVGTACGGRQVHRRSDRPRPDPVLRCTELRARTPAPSAR